MIILIFDELNYLYIFFNYDIRNDILNTPLTPYMGADWLDCHHLHVSGASIEATGFSYQHPLMTEELFRESIQHAIECGIFPASCYSE